MTFIYINQSEQDFAIARLFIQLLVQHTLSDLKDGIGDGRTFSHCHARLKFSKLHSNTSALDIARHLAGTTEVRLAAIACRLLYMRSYIGPILSSIGDEMNQELLDWIFPEPATVSVTAADLQQMLHDVDKVQVRLDEYETVQRDMLCSHGFRHQQYHIAKTSPLAYRE